jgi:uncharacterized protein (DUF427 family)
MQTPGPDHPITITPAGTRWRAFFAGHVIADSANAVVLQEANYPPVVYFPREDVSMEYMSRTDRSSHCPYKGDAAYYTVLMDGQFAENAVWTYEAPYPAMDQIAERLAFYTDKIEVYPVDDAAVNPRADEKAELDRPVDIDATVQHTDSGSGASQREHWPANVSVPATNDDGGLH